MSSPVNESILTRFRPHVATWFQEVFAEPTAVQAAAWKSISAGENALVVAPTGSGKTLAAFLWALNSLVERDGQTAIPLSTFQGQDLSFIPQTPNFEAPEPVQSGQETNSKPKQSGSSTQSSVVGDGAGSVVAVGVSGGGSGSPVSGAASNGGVKVLYISPLKALGVDVERNLRAPLAGINNVALRMGIDPADISVGVRSGDTPAAERNRQIRKPPDILITTPESAYLMLTSKAAAILKCVDTVIIDEIHAIAGTKRGVHMALTLERLERLVGRPIQRVGLSATVRPLETVAKFLAGDRPVDIINPPAHKQWDLQVHVPVPDLSDLPTAEPGSTIGELTMDDPLGLSTPLPGREAFDAADLGASDSGASDLGAEQTAVQNLEGAAAQNRSIWPHIAQGVYEEIMEHRSTLVFVNSRRSAEKLTSAINELYAAEHNPDALAEPMRRPPAQLMKPTDVAGTADPLIARAHHGSVSKDERAMIETMLKEGTLKAVVSTSSLELGIDMGAVDLVIQVEAPPSVASGLQRVGRAGHVVGAVSAGSMYPKHRQDLVQTAVTVKRMRAGQIEKIQVPSNALDVLTQQTIAAVAVEDIHVDEWFATVTRSYPYRDLDREVFNAVIDLASGVYPSTDFAELRPRVVYDRITGMLSARPGAQRVAVTSGGTIPDRGMFGVFLVGGEQGARRVGELDEEMVYESRVGDVFTLGASSWRIEEITRDQVLVSPAPGLTGRLPFWTGDQLGRPYELGLALGAFRREVLADPTQVDRPELGLDAYARDNLVRFLQQQREETGLVPDEKTLLLERFRDELGDWRVVLHTPFGRGVNAAWALAVGARISEQSGIDAQPVSSDDGIVLRLPDAEQEPGADLFTLDADEVEGIISQQVGNSALFASRFRECAARALLLPRRNPGKRAPLWQQRQRAAQLLDVARQYPNFPIILETVRECLHDVYDLPSLVEVLRNLALRRVQIAEVTTQQPSAFASSMLFNYTGAFMYEGDSPLAEKRAAALALDLNLLAKLLGQVELRELLDQEVIQEVHAQLQRETPERQVRNLEELVDALRILGPVPVDVLPTKCAFALAGEEPLAAARRIADQLAGRVMLVRIAGIEHLAVVEDAALLRDGLGVPVPAGVAAQVAPVHDALAQLIRRWARTRGPFCESDLQRAFGLPASVVHGALAQEEAAGRLVKGRFRTHVVVTGEQCFEDEQCFEGEQSFDDASLPASTTTVPLDEQEYVAKDVLSTIRARSLAAARAQTQPVSQSALGRFLPAWQQVAAVGEHPELHGVDGVLAAVEQLAGVRLPASAWETMVLPQRVRGYQQGWLDELLYSGEVIAVGAGAAGANDPWIRLLPVDYAAQLLPQLDPPALSNIQEQILTQLRQGGGFLAADIFSHVTGEDLGLVAGHATTQEVREAMWGLFEAGLIMPDSLAPIRARLAAGSGGSSAHRAKRTPNRSRLRAGRTRFTGQQRPLDMVGRWQLTPTPDTDPTSRSVAHGEAWLDRYGVVTRGSVVAEDVLGGFALAYKVLRGFEESGKAMRGYIVDGLGAAQFSTPAVIDRLRGMDDSPDPTTWPSGSKEPAVYLLAACDPANPYGAALPWPGAHKVTRAAGATVVLIDGLAIAHLGRGGKTLTLFDPEQIPLVVWALRHHPQHNLTIETIDATPALQSPLLDAFRTAGASITPRGVRIAAEVHTPGPQQGRSLSEALETLDDAPTQPPRGAFRSGGFRSSGYRR